APGIAVRTSSSAERVALIRLPEIRDVRVHDFPVSVTLLEHQGDRRGRRGRRGLGNLGRSSGGDDGRRVAVETGDRNRTICVELDQPITIFGESLNAG